MGNEPADNSAQSEYPDCTDARSAILHHTPETVPWLDGPTLRYLRTADVLDLKIPDDPDFSPIVPHAKIGAYDPIQDMITAPDTMYDAVFVRDAVLRARGSDAAFATWFSLLRVLGVLVISIFDADTMPNQPDATPEAFNIAQAGETGPRTLKKTIAMLEAALPENEFAILHSSAAPARWSAPVHATHQLNFVIQKLPLAGNRNTIAGSPFRDTQRPYADIEVPFLRVTGDHVHTPGMRTDGNLLVRDFAPKIDQITRIIVLKLDHHGDFIIGLPALRDLRESFPNAHIRLLCGPWNVEAAHASGLVDDVQSYAYFPERAVDWTGTPSDGWAALRAITAGYFDLAIDLRVDEDTRPLLGRIDAGLRCGIGSRARFPLLDIALPDSARDPLPRQNAPGQDVPPQPADSLWMPPDSFNSSMEIKTASCHQTSLRVAYRLLLESEAISLRRGRYSVSFDLQTKHFLPGPTGAGIRIEVAPENADTLSFREFGRSSMRRLTPDMTTLQFSSAGSPARYLFRVRSIGKPLMGHLRFQGLRLRRLNADGPRYSPSELHVGEKLSLLIALIRQRTLPLNGPDPKRPVITNTAGRRLHIIIAPFSNSTIRDWPMAHYARLIDNIAKTLDAHIDLTGSPAQIEQAARLMALIDSQTAHEHVSNQVGKTSWADTATILRAADLVICNNSGIAHQSASLGVPTLAIYSASHQPLEWGPRGPRARAIMMGVGCSPCGYERIEECDNKHLCMTLITPEAVLAQAQYMLGIEPAQSAPGN